MASKIPTSRIVQLAAIVSTSVAEIDAVLAAKGLSSPSFDEDAPDSLPQEVSAAKDAVLDAVVELRDLLLDPLDQVYKYNGHNNPVALQAIARFEIASMVPHRGQVSFAEVATHTGLDEKLLRRLLRHAMTMRVFYEPEPGMISHTKASKLFANSDMNDWLRIGTEEMWPAATKMLEAVQKWPESSEPNETGFCLSNNSAESIYEIIGSNPEKANRFANAMKAFTRRPEYDPAYIVDNYDWASLGNAQVVDVGGARGHVALCLSRRFENLTVIAQDMNKVVENAEDEIPTESRAKVKFMAHDLFAPQTLQVDAYLFRWVLHNWSDKYCVMILQALIPALKAGAKIIIQETCMPKPGAIPLWREKDLRAEDLNMTAIFNSQERTIDEWTALLTHADTRFVLKGVIEPKGSALGIMEVVWGGTDE